MITRALTGVALIDEPYGGIYRGRAMLACGRSGTGKTIFGLQFLRQGLLQGEHCLMCSAHPSTDLTIYAEALGIPIEEAINRGALILMEYRGNGPDRDLEAGSTLPPADFQDLIQTIDTNAVQRVVLDTVLPWVAIQSQANLAEHVFSFVRAFDRLNTTTLLTIPKPVSPMACRLKNAIDKIVPISLAMSVDAGSGKRFFSITKYLGRQDCFSEIEYAIMPRTGIAKVDPAKLTTRTQPEKDAQRASIPELQDAPASRAKPSFSSFIQRVVSSSPAPDGSGAGARPTPGKIRFSSVIQATGYQSAGV